MILNTGIFLLGILVGIRLSKCVDRPSHWQGVWRNLVMSAALCAFYMTARNRLAQLKNLLPTRKNEK
jgi:hypothetical protein